MRCILLLLLLCLLTPSSWRPPLPLAPGVPAGPKLTEADRQTHGTLDSACRLTSLSGGAPEALESRLTHTHRARGALAWGEVSTSPPGTSPYLWPLDTLWSLLSDPRGPPVSLDAPVSLEPRGSQRSWQPRQSGKAAGPCLSLDAGVAWGAGAGGLRGHGGGGQHSTWPGKGCVSTVQWLWWTLL